MDELFFIVSKLAWSVLSPSAFFVGLTLLALVFLYCGYLQTAKTLLLTMTLIGFTVMAYPVGDILLEKLEQRFSVPAILPEQIDGIIVLGGGEQLKTSLSWQAPQSGEAGDRYLAAAMLARHYPQTPLWVSGGSNLVQQPQHHEVADIHRQLLLMAGVSASKIHIEQNSRNTYENIHNLFQVIPEPDGQYLLVTSAYHMPRSMGIARKLGLNVIAYPVDYRSQRGDQRQWDFALFEHLETLEPAIREWLGLTIYYLTGKTSQFLPGQLTGTDDNADVR
ncbi:MAG: YdcF family protein [Methylophaga sp.]|nr:YdcF family protein [Methylophaga sp.]